MASLLYEFYPTLGTMSHFGDLSIDGLVCMLVEINHQIWAGCSRENCGMMTLVTILAISGNFYNDVLALVSMVGTLIMFFGSFPNSPVRRYIGSVNGVCLLCSLGFSFKLP